MELSLFGEWAEKNGWRSEPPSRNFSVSEHPVLSRYQGLGEIAQYIAFLNSFSRLESKDECVWFLFPDDFKTENDTNEFAWNEFERISAEASFDDREAASVREWWSRHLPILLSVRNGYSFYAIDIDTQNIVYGFEPEFEETSIAANSFEEFLKKIISGEISL